MTREDWREKKRGATRLRLSQAAFALFERDGYEATSVGDIATAADVSVPTFYAYFRTKEHVVFPDQDGAWIAGLLTEQPADLPLPERVRRGLQRLVAQLTESDAQALLHRWWLALTVPALRSRGADRETASTAALVDVLGIDLSTSEGAAQVVVIGACMAASTTAFLRWAATDGERDLGELVDEAFEALRSI